MRLIKHGCLGLSVIFASGCTTVRPRLSVDSLAKCWITCKEAKTLDYIEQEIFISGLGYTVDQGSLRCYCKDRTIVELRPNSADRPIGQAPSK